MILLTISGDIRLIRMVARLLYLWHCGYFMDDWKGSAALDDVTIDEATVECAHMGMWAPFTSNTYIIVTLLIGLLD